MKILNWVHFILFVKHFHSCKFLFKLDFYFSTWHKINLSSFKSQFAPVYIYTVQYMGVSSSSSFQMQVIKMNLWTMISRKLHFKIDCCCLLCSKIYKKRILWRNFKNWLKINSKLTKNFMFIAMEIGNFLLHYFFSF